MKARAKRTRRTGYNYTIADIAKKIGTDASWAGRYAKAAAVQRDPTLYDPLLDRYSRAGLEAIRSERDRTARLRGLNVAKAGRRRARK